jgi:hypothetical protein
MVNMASASIKILNIVFPFAMGTDRAMCKEHDGHIALCQAISSASNVALPAIASDDIA